MQSLNTWEVIRKKKTRPKEREKGAHQAQERFRDV